MDKSKHFTGQPVFNQLLSLIPRSLVRKLSRKHNADRYYKKFKAYDHLVTMLFSSLHQCTSLRELITGLQASSSRLRHLGLLHTPRRATLADANSRRSPVFFEELYHALYQVHYGSLPDSLLKKRRAERLFIVDATTVSVFSTAMAGNGSFGLNGKKKGGTKAHVLMRAIDDVPCFVRITPAVQNDRTFLPLFKLPTGSIIVMDRGYNNYQQLLQWTRQKVTWIMRPNARAVYKIIQQRALSNKHIAAGIVEDRIIELGNPKTAHLNPIQKVRMVVLYDRSKKMHYEFITNDLKSGPVIITDLYKQRWQIEMLFKRIKQNFNLHDFLGDNENAIRIQLWCTLIADLLIKIIRDKVAKRRNWSMANLSGLIRLHLSTYINLKVFLANPERALLNYEDPLDKQLSLFKT